MRIRYRDWPFEENEHVVLHWLRSPFQAEVKKLWKMEAIFKKDNGSFQVLTIPWGALPILGLGSIFSNGKPTGVMAQGAPTPIRFSTNARAKICSGYAVPPQYGLKDSEKNERCVIVWENGRQIVIPCLVVIRSYFALNRMMTTALLRPDSFSDLCAAELVNEEANLTFYDHVATTSLSPEVVKRMALILFEHNFYNSWRKVWASLAQPVNSKTVPALQTEPPGLAGSVWDTVSIEYGNTTLVLQIREFTPAVKQPFSSVSYSHPSFRKYEREQASDRGNDLPEDDDQAGEVNILPGSQSPSNISRPLSVKIAFTVARLRDPVELIKLQEAVRSNPREDNGSGSGRNKNTQKSSSDKDGTLNDEGGYGELPSVEFTHYKSLENITAGFNQFFKALGHIDKHIDQACISFFEGKTPQGCNLPKSPKGSDVPRPHVLVCVAVPKKRFFLVEVDVSDGHSMSTLVFALDEKQKITDVAEKVLKNGIAVGGNWDKKKLVSLLGSRRFELVKHLKSSSSGHWGNRIWRAGQLL